MKNPANPRPVKPHQPEGKSRILINGQILEGVKDGGRWTFQCDPWRQLAKDHRGDESAESIVAEFMSKALAGAVTTTASKR